MRPARYQVRLGLRTVVDTDTEVRAREYADRWAWAAKREAQVVDTQAVNLSIYGAEPSYQNSVVYVARPPSDQGIPLPRPYNPPVNLEM